MQRVGGAKRNRFDIQQQALGLDMHPRCDIEALDHATRHVLTDLAEKASGPDAFETLLPAGSS